MVFLGVYAPYLAVTPKREAICSAAVMTSAEHTSAQTHKHQTPRERNESPSSIRLGSTEDSPRTEGGNVLRTSSCSTTTKTCTPRRDNKEGVCAATEANGDCSRTSGSRQAKVTSMQELGHRNCVEHARDKNNGDCVTPSTVVAGASTSSLVQRGHSSSRECTRRQDRGKQKSTPSGPPPPPTSPPPCLARRTSSRDMAPIARYTFRTHFTANYHQVKFAVHASHWCARQPRPI